MKNKKKYFIAAFSDNCFIKDSDYKIFFTD